MARGLRPIVIIGVSYVAGATSRHPHATNFHRKRAAWQRPLPAVGASQGRTFDHTMGRCSGRGRSSKTPNLPRLSRVEQQRPPQPLSRVLLLTRGTAAGISAATIPLTERQA